LHDLTLNLTELQDTFLFSKQLFNFRDHLIQIPKIDESRKRELLKVENQIKKHYPISLTAAKQSKNQGRRSSQPPSTALDAIAEDRTLQASFKAINVLHHVVSTLETHNL